jgi:serine/threonine protein kinase
MIGKTISHYRIIEKLGEGGMGVVYQAEDTKLKRTVALKFLPQGLETHEPERARLLQEAQATATLNHPNICTIHDISEFEDQQFIVMEYVDGQTLRKLVPIPKFQEAISFAIQIGEALQEAHSKGVIHRDIKTDNIMVNSRNQVKVMDFGLAKLKGTLKLTKTSSTVGTLAYMAPEQIQGTKVDARSDIFSFGVVLYELLTGHLPFDAMHEAAMMYAILNEPPQPIQKYLPEASSELLHIVNRALEKNPEERYQTVHDLLIDLRRVQKQTSRVIHPSAAELPLVEPSTMVEKTSALPKAWIIVAGILLVVALVSLYILFRSSRSTTPITEMKFSRLTTTGRINNAVISPDERFIVYSQREKGKQSLWMRQIATASTIQILPLKDVYFQSLTLSKDGNYLYYVIQEVGSPVWSLYKMPLLGGTSKKILDDVQSSISLSPDGKQFAFTRFYPESGEFALMIANEDGSGDRILATHKGDKWFTSKPSWSPDGETIVCPLGDYQGGMHTIPMSVQVKDGSEKLFTTRGWMDITSVNWLSDGSGLIVTAQEKGSTVNQLWLVKSKDGSVRRITNDLSNYSTISLAQDSRSLCTIQSEIRASLWLVPSADAAKARQITTGKEDGLVGLTFTPEGGLLYTNQAQGNGDLWICNADGSNQKQLTTETSHEQMPAVSPDGQTVFFVSDRAGIPNIWKISIDGSKLQQLTFGGEDYNPNVSIDGKWLYFSSWDTGPSLIMKIPVEGGEPTTVFARSAAFVPKPSPDGKFLAFGFVDDQHPGKEQVLIIPSAGGEVVKTLELPTTALISSYSLFALFQWTPDSRAISYIDTREDISNIWVIALSGGEPKKLTNFTSDYIFTHAWSTNGKQLMVSRGQWTSDVVLISNFR